jgi:tryptophan 2,3-dioxygenase
MLEKKLTDYERYIRTEELLALQKPKADRVNRDELLFQSVHQAAEIMMKCLINEADEVVTLLNHGQLSQAAHYTRRMGQMLDNLTHHIAVLESMTPADYHVIRLGALGRGSGQESPGFNQILALGEPLWKAFEAERQKIGTDLLTLFRTPRAHWDLWLVVQAFMAFDESLQHWRFGHFELVKRIIGSEVMSLKNVPASQLAYGLQESFFPELWKTVNVLTRETRPGY